jgi:hypothetical protein
MVLDEPAGGAAHQGNRDVDANFGLDQRAQVSEDGTSL